MRSLLGFTVGLFVLSLGGCSLIFDSDDYVGDDLPSGCDADGDGFAKMTPECDNGTDCDDTNPAVYPGAPPDCTTAVHENCDASDMESFRNMMMLGPNQTEAGYLPTVRIENRPSSENAQEPLSLTGTTGGYADGTGYALWIERGAVMVARFELHDPRTYVLTSPYHDDGVGSLDGVVGIAACAASTSAVAVTLVEAYDVMDPNAANAQIGSISFNGSALSYDFTEIDDLFPTPSSERLLAEPAGVTNCYHGTPGAMASGAPFHVIRGTLDGSSFMASIRHTSAPTMSDFELTTAGSQPAYGPEPTLGTAGRHAFVAGQNTPLLYAWEAATATVPPVSIPLTDGDPQYPGGSVSVGYVAGASADPMSYLMAVPQGDDTYIHRIDCPAPGASCTNTLSGPTDTITDFGRGSPSLTAMSTWSTPMAGTGAVLSTAVTGSNGAPLNTLHFIADNGLRIPLYTPERDELLGTGYTEDMASDLEVSTVVEANGFTVLVASRQYGDFGGTRDYQIGGFRICGHP